MLHILFKKMLPKQDGFITLFEQHVDNISDIASNLNDLLKSGYDDKIVESLAASEQKADEVAGEIYKLLSASFITPFRRSEIRDLISKLDDIADYSEDVAKRAKIYNIKSFTPEMAELSEQAKVCVDLLKQAVPLLSAVSKNAEKINELCKQIHEVEDKADKIYDKGLYNLFHEEGLVIGGVVVSSKTPYEKLYDLIEEVVDACDDVAKVLGNIVAENA